MSRAKRFPCSLEAGKISPCFALDEVLQSPGGRGTRMQGVEIQTMMNMETLKFSRHLAVVKSGQRAKKGLVLNFCPFCRAELVEGAEKSVANAINLEAQEVDA